MPAQPGRRQIIASLLSGSAALGLSGCGFQPIYMPTASGKAGPAERGLAAIDVLRIPDRPGQLLRQALQAKLGGAALATPRFDLAVNYSIAGEGVGVYSDYTATRIRMTASASWFLNAHPPAIGAITSGSARAIDAMNVFDAQYFASDLETETVQRRLANAVADQIAMQLAIWFRRHPDRTG